MCINVFVFYNNAMLCFECSGQLMLQLMLMLNPLASTRVRNISGCREDTGTTKWNVNTNTP